MFLESPQVFIVTEICSKAIILFTNCLNHIGYAYKNLALEKRGFPEISGNNNVHSEDLYLRI